MCISDLSDLSDLVDGESSFQSHEASIRITARHSLHGISQLSEVSWVPVSTRFDNTTRCEVTNPPEYGQSLSPPLKTRVSMPKLF